MLFIFSGLPGTGKTTLARYVARQLPAVYIRIDTLEQTLVRTGLVTSKQMGPAGYMLAYSLTEDNLQLGLHVVADSVNPLRITRDAWRNIAIESSTPYLEIELVCSDIEEHRRRIEGRTSDIHDLILPGWGDVLDREYEPWDQDRLILDTAKLSIEAAAERIITACTSLLRSSTLH